MKLDRAVYIFVLAPIGAVVLISALLLFGVKPQRVFAFGFAVRSLLTGIGLPSPKAAGVLGTGFLFWAAIVVAGLLWDRRKRHE